VIEAISLSTFPRTNLNSLAGSGVRIRTARSALATSCCIGLLLLFGARASFAASEPEFTEAILEVTLSAAVKGETMVVLRDAAGGMYLEEGDFTRLRLPAPKGAGYEHDGRRFFPLDTIPGCSVVIDTGLQRAVITVPAGALASTHVSAEARAYPRVTPTAPGAFFNYQLSAQQYAGTNFGGSYAEFGMFAGAGVITNSSVARYSDRSAQWVRLDTTYTKDFPDTLQTLSVGDAISDPGSWGNALRFAGVRFSRNFELRPDLLTTPLLSTSGTAVVPSTVDVFINNQLAASSPLPAGPFILDRLPTVSGSGDVNVVVRDALGREQVLTQSFYSSLNLLAPGLSQYSVDIGSVRNAYALASEQYGSMLGEVSYRRGITDAFTLEGHGEYLANSAHAAGVNAALALSSWGILNLTAAQGGNAQGSGWLTGVGLEHRDARFSFIANTSWASGEFDQVGEPLNPAMRVMRRSLAQAGVALGGYGSLSAASVWQSYRDAPTQQILSLTHSVSFGRIGSLNLTLSRTHSAAFIGALAQESTSAYLTYIFTLEGRRAVSATAIAAHGQGAQPDELIATVSQSPPVGPGSGYRFSSSTTGDYDANWRQQFTAADLEVEAARNQCADGRSAYLSGALTLLDGQVHATRAVNGSFAVVDVAGLADVPVYVENQLTAHTDATGRALLYNLRPYEANRISIAPEDLPLDTAIAASSTLLVPAFRSGVIARFPVERIRSATFRLVTVDGKPVPAGAEVLLHANVFPVVQDGVVYVTGYDHGTAAEAQWDGGHCRFRLEPPPADEPLPDMGTIRCH
jgi:outer membrane usher protein